MKYIILTMVSGLLLLGVAHEARAQANCLSADTAIKQLREEHDEIIIARMKDPQNVPMQLWANLETGSWTLVFLAGNEAGTKMCLLDEGQGFRVGGFGAN